MKLKVQIQTFKLRYFLLFIVILAAPFNLLMQLDYVILPAWLSYFLLSYLLGLLFWFRSDDYLYATVLVFYYIFLIIAPLLQTLDTSFPWGGIYSAANMASAWWITFVSLLFFELGYLCLRKGSNDNIKANTPHFVLTNRGKMMLFAIAILCTLFGLGIIGVGTLFLPRNESTEMLGDSFANSSVRAIIIAILKVPPVLIFLLLIHDIILQIKVRANPKNIRFTIMLIFTLFLVIAIINNPISTPRFWIGAIFFSVLLLYVVIYKKMSAAGWFVLNVTILVSVFPIMDMFRNSLDTSVVEAVANIDPKGELSTSPDFDAFQQQMNTVIVRDVTTYSYGSQFASSMLFFVPRNFWPGKLEASGIYIAENVGYKFLNLSAPLPVEFYLDGWFFGVAIGMFLVGVCYKRVLNLYRFNTSPLPVVFYCFFCSYQVFFLRGSLMAVIGYLFVGTGFLVATHLVRRMFFEKQIIKV